MALQDAKIDLKKRPPLPFQVSENTLGVMDATIQNLKDGLVSEKIDISEFED